MFHRLRRVTFLQSLQFQLLFFLPVVFFTVIFAALVAERSIADSFLAYVSDKPQATLKTTLADLDNYNRISRGQPNHEVEQALVNQIGTLYGEHVIVVNQENVVIAATERSLVGSTLKLASAVAKQQPAVSCGGLSANTVIISIDQTVICPDSSMLLGAKLDMPTEQHFLTSVNAAVWLSVGIAGLMTFLFLLIVSHTIIKPLKRMTKVAHHMEDGDLSQRLNVKMHNEIGELAQALNTMADSLQFSERLRRNMINDIAHELRTPLTNIRGYLEALQDQVVRPTPETIASLYEESTLLTRLVSDLQELSLAEAGQLCLFTQPVALHESILKAVHMFQLRAAQKDIKLDVDLPDNLPLVEADPERVAQILRNLFTNAIAYSFKGGCITVTAQARNDEIVISVQDTGNGIEAQHLPFVFERFYRADPSRTRSTGGTGLGLAIVKQIVQAHRGRVSVESQPGCGSRFAFTLPIFHRL